MLVKFYPDNLVELLESINMDDELKKQALQKLLQDPQLNNQLSKGQMLGPGILTDESGHVPWNKYAENLGISGAPISELIPGLKEAVYSSPNAKYSGGGVSDRKMGIPSPAMGQPSLNRQGGPLDPSPAGTAGTLAGIVTDPQAYGFGRQLGAGVKKLIPLEEEVTGKALLSPEQMAANVKKNGVEQHIDNKVQEILKPGTEVSGRKATQEELEAIRNEIPEINKAVQTRGPIQFGLPRDKKIREEMNISPELYELQELLKRKTAEPRSPRFNSENVPAEEMNISPQFKRLYQMYSKKPLK